MINSSKLLNRDTGKNKKGKFFIQANKKIVSIGGFLQKSFLKKRSDAIKKRNEELKARREREEQRLEDRKTNPKSSVRGFGRKLGRLSGVTNLVDGFKNAIGKLLFGFFALKLLQFYPLLQNILPMINGAANFLSAVGIGLIDTFARIVDFGYNVYDSTKGFLKQVGGENIEGAFDKFMGAVSSLIDVLLLATLIRAGGGFGGPRKTPSIGDGFGPFGGGRRGRGGRGPRKPKDPKDPKDPKKPDAEKPRGGFPAGTALAGALAAALIFAATRGRVRVTPAQALNTIRKSRGLRNLIKESRLKSTRERLGARRAAEAEVKQTQRTRKKVFSQQRVEAEVGGRGGTTTSGKGGPSGPERPPLGRGVDPSRMQPEVIQEMITGKKPTTRSKSGGGRTQPPQQQSTSTSKPGKMLPARTVVRPAIITDKALSNRILSDDKFRNLFLEHLQEKFKFRNPQGRITKGITLDEFAALNGTTTDQLIKSELAKKGPTSFKGRLKLTQQQVVPLKPQVKIPRTRDGFIKPNPPTAEMLQRIIPKSPKAKVSFFKRLFGFTGDFFARIPVIGPLVDFGINLAFGDPLPKAATKAIFAAIFGAVGIAAGSVVPGAGNVIGGILGGLAGDIIGGVLYDMVVNNFIPSEAPVSPETLSNMVDPEGKFAGRKNKQRAKDLAAVIREGESGDNYGATYSGYLSGFPRKNEDITKMTIAEVVDYQNDYLDYQKKLGIPATKRSAAVGAYQMLTPDVAANQLKIPLTAKFNKATQDKLLNYYLDKRGRQQYEAGQITAEEYNNRLAAEFASLKTTMGGGVYDNDGINKATKSVLDLLKKDYKDRSQGIRDQASYEGDQGSVFLIYKNFVASNEAQQTNNQQVVAGGNVAKAYNDAKNILYMVG